MDEAKFRKLSVIAQVTGLAVVVIGAVISLLQFDTSIRNQVHMPIWQERIEAHVDAASVAAIIASPDASVEAIKEAKTKFYSLYYGRLVLFEDATVCDAMVKFEAEIESNKPTTTTALKLANTIRNSLNKAADRKEIKVAGNACNDRSR